MSILISDLKTVPGIIGSLGLGIADAQKELNAEYLRSIGVLIDLVKALVPGPEAEVKADDDPAKKDLAFRRQAMTELLIQLAPPRYQYTRTELHVRMDLSQSTDKAMSVGGGISLSAVAVNGSFAMASSIEYRAAAECHTVIDAILPTGNNEAIFKDLVAAAKTQEAAALPAAVTGHDNATIELAKEVAGKFGLKAPAAQK